MHLELFDQEGRHSLGQSDEFRRDDWMVANADEFVYNLIPINVKVTRKGRVVHGKVVFDSGRRSRLNIDPNTPKNKVFPGLTMTFAARSLRIRQNDWYRCLRKGTGAVAQAIVNGELVQG